MTNNNKVRSNFNNVYFKLEDKIKDQYKIDPLDPVMYTYIKDLAERIIVLRKWCEDRDSIEEIAHEYATYLYMKIADGLVVNSWTKYMMLGIKGTIRRYKARNRKVVIEITDPVEFRMLLDSLYSSAYDDTSDEDAISYIESLYSIIKELVLKYSDSSDIWFNRALYLSVLAKLQNVNCTIYPEVSDVYATYITRLVCNNIYIQSVDLFKNDIDLSKLFDAELLPDNE